MRKIKLFILTFFLFGSVASALTLSEIRDQVRIRIKDSYADRERYSDEQLNSFINESHRDVVNAAWPILKRSTIALVTDQCYYEIPEDVIDISHILITPTYVPLSEDSFEGMDSKSPGWFLATGRPSKYVQDDATPQYIRVHPCPNSVVTSTGNLIVYYFSQANVLSSDSDIPFNNQDRYLPYNDTLTLLTCYKIFLLEGELQKAQFCLQEYESRVSLMRDRIRSKPNFMPGFSGNRGP